MLRIVIRKLVETAGFVLFITLISFLFIRLAPGDPVLTILNVDELAVSREQVEALREELGFNKPLLLQYAMWLWDLVRLDFGRSFVTGQSVAGMIMAGLPATLELAGGGLLVMLMIALPLGSLSALYRDRWIDHVSRMLAIVGAAVPSFWLGLLLIDWLGVRWALLPTMGRDGWSTLILPSLTLGLAIAGVYVRLLRSSLLDSLSQEFVRAARARGYSEWRIFRVHVFRHSLPPVITVFGVSLGSLIGGVIVIEVLFAYPGIGKLIVDSIRQRDYPVIQGYILLMAVIVFVVNTAVDLSYRFLNPELRFKEKKAGV
ncbi:nickel ABC transporter permease [Paenibacillus campi]|uniref:nickel ABC transporter permease n=1 Tax=Paenibacillus campi TaxID=3106031 RepID=UPI002AFFB1BB|nr:MULTISPECIES: nickel ABC transporter permease [unclassified Paenibacillus]